MQSDHASPAMTSKVIGAVGAYGAKFLKQHLCDVFEGERLGIRAFKLRQAVRIDGTGRTERPGQGDE